MDAYDLEQWHELFVMLGGAGAALAWSIAALVVATNNAWTLLVEIRR